MPHVTFGETYPTRRSYDTSRAIVVVPKRNEDDKAAIVEDSCGKVTKTIYPALPPPLPPKERRPPSPPLPQKCDPPPVSERSNVPSEDVRNRGWTKIIVRNSRGMIWKIVHVDCYGKTMKTEYPEPEPPRRQYTETKRYFIKEIDSSPPRKHHSEMKKVVVDQEVRQPPPKSSSENVKVEKYQFQATVESDDGSTSSEEPSEPVSAPPPSPPQASVTDSTITDRRDSVTISSGKASAESTREVIKDENGVVKKVIYTDSRGRRRTVVYDDDD